MGKQPLFKDWDELKRVSRVTPNGVSKGPVKHVVLDGDDVMWHIYPYGLASTCRPVGKTAGNQLSCEPVRRHFIDLPLPKLKKKKQQAETGAIFLEPSLRDLLDQLKNQGIGVSVASQNDKSAVHNMLEAFGLAGKFDVVKAGWESKAKMVSGISQAKKLEPRNVLFVDDNKFNVFEVQEMGAQAVAFNSDIHKLSDILRYIKESEAQK